MQTDEVRRIASRKHRIPQTSKEKVQWLRRKATGPNLRQWRFPKEGYFEFKQGNYGPVFPRDPRMLRVHHRRETQAGTGGCDAQLRQQLRKRDRGRSALSRAAKLHYLRWVLFDIDDETCFMYQGIFDTDFDKYTEDAVALFRKTGIGTAFENLEGFPEDWKTNVAAFVKFVREHQCPSFLEYGEYPYVSGDEIKKALKIKSGARRRCSDQRCNERPEPDLQPASRSAEIRQGAPPVQRLLAWSYPGEANRDVTELDNRFSTMTEVRRVAWPAYESAALLGRRCSSRASRARSSCSSGAW